MSRYDYDYFVIGGGSGGVRSARIAAGFGAKAAIAENHRFGGTCVIRGCVPKKLLSYASHFREDFEDAAGFGWTVGPASFSWPKLIANKDAEIARLERVYQNLLVRSGVELFEAKARIADAHTVEVDGRRVTAKYILVATGAWPRMPDIPGIEHCISSNEAFQLPELPHRILVVGGGYIAVEFAGIFNGLGAKVTLSYRGDEILRGFDDEVRSHLHEEMAAKGIRILVKSNVSSVEKSADGSLVAHFENALFDSMPVDAVMFATGRTPNTRGLGLEEAGVMLGADGAVLVDERSCSSVPSIYAVGDVTNRINLTPVAIREGQAVATTLFGGRELRADHADVPSAVFSHPPVGTVGLTEAQAVAKYGVAEVYWTSFRPLKATLSGRAERTFMKLVIDQASRRVVGAHMVGDDAPEIIQGIAIAVKAGLTKEQFDATVGIHPTAAEELVTLKDHRVASAPVV
jgi:glutathione reductase (NADPH)